MSVTKKQAETAFKKLGVRRKSSNHHIAGWVEKDGKKLFLIHCSKGRGDMPGRAGDRFIRSLFLKRAEFVEFAACRIAREEYFEIIARRLQSWI